MKLTYDQMREAISLLSEWQRIVQKEKGKEFSTAYSLGTTFDADHSLRGGLLGWLLAGNKPLEHPPPLYMSRPWHRLVSEGFAEGEGPIWWPEFTLKGFPEGWTSVIIGQHPWGVLCKISEDKQVVRYHTDNGDVWMLHLLEESDFSGFYRFRLVALDTVDGKGLGEPGFKEEVELVYKEKLRLRDVESPRD